VGDETILGRSVRLLASRGIKKFTVVDGFCGDQIRSALLSDFPSLDFNFVRNEDYRTTNNAWSLMLADCRGDEPIFLLDSDILFAPEVLDVILAAPQPNRLGLRTTGTVGEEEMKVRLGENGLVHELTKEMPPSAAAGESVGLEVFSRQFTTALHVVLQRRMHVDKYLNEYYEEAFSELAQAGHDIHPVDLGALLCMEVDTVEDLESARQIFTSQ